MIPYSESESYKKTNEKVQKLIQVRTLVKQLVADIPDYQIKAWCRANEKDLAADITLDWIKYKDTLSDPDKKVVVELWKDVLQMTANEVTTRVRNYGK